RGTEDVCGLGEIPTFRAIPPHRIRIEVAAWRPDLITFTDERGLAEVRCPAGEDVFTPTGEIRAEFEPRPAFGGVAVFDVASEANHVDVPLACTEPAQLASPACVDDELILVTAVVRDLEASAVLDADQASSVTVSVVEPIAAQDDDGDTIVTVPAGDTIRLRPGLVG